MPPARRRVPDGDPGPGEGPPGPAPRPPAGSEQILGLLTADDTRTLRLATSTDLLDPDDVTLADLLAPARRLLVITGGPHRTRLLSYLDALCDSGRLDGYHVAPDELLPEGKTLTVAARLADAAQRAGLARRDAFLVHGPHPGAAPALVAAALFRRHTTAVRVVTDPAWLATALSTGPVTLGGAVGVLPRQVTVAIDLQGFGAASPSPGTPLSPPRPGAGLVKHYTERTLTYPVEAVTDIWGLTAGPRPDDRLRAWLPTGSRVLAVVDAFSPRVMADVRRSLRSRHDRREIAGFDVHAMTVSPAVKSLTGLDDLLRVLDRARLGPRDRVLAVGGGTLLDLAGAAALTYRGRTPYIRIPTTLVGFIDAGIGLKVGVDTYQGKNQLGGYHPPLACLVDHAFLDTLPDVEIRCGLAEAIKIAAVADAELFDLIERSHGDLEARKDTPDTRRVIERSVAVMLRELSVNPFEHDLRRVPDFGHEFGHLLESHSPRGLRHGEAVSVGMAVSGQLAVHTGRLDPREHRRMITLLRRVGLPVHDPLCTPARLAGWLPDIRAHKGGSPHLVVPTSMGTSDFIDDPDEFTPGLFAAACRGLAEDAR
ncbi:MAG: iron-containing alcohol dehydrogenase [Actinomycetota bacterium]|nr:iron-containing alcohol dehydrogenase [Actinomycetota bacterium]